MDRRLVNQIRRCSGRARSPSRMTRWLPQPRGPEARCPAQLAPRASRRGRCSVFVLVEQLPRAMAGLLPSGPTNQAYHHDATQGRE